MSAHVQPNLTLVSKPEMPEMPPVPSVKVFQAILEQTLLECSTGNMINVSTMFAHIGMHIRSLTARVQELEAGYVRPHFSPN